MPPINPDPTPYVPLSNSSEEAIKMRAQLDKIHAQANLFQRNAESIYSEAIGTKPVATNGEYAQLKTARTANLSRDLQALQGMVNTFKSQIAEVTVAPRYEIPGDAGETTVL